MKQQRRATGAAKDPDPKVEKAKQGIQKNAEKLNNLPGQKPDAHISKAGTITNGKK